MSSLVYDGDCPFCSNYVAFLDLKKRFPDLELVNARDYPNHPAVETVRSKGLLIDDGMALVDGDQVHHGAEAIHALATDRGINGRVFGSLRRAKALYPLLRAGRNLTLKLMGRSKLGF